MNPCVDLIQEENKSEKVNHSSLKELSQLIMDSKQVFNPGEGRLTSDNFSIPFSDVKCSFTQVESNSFGMQSVIASLPNDITQFSLLSITKGLNHSSSKLLPLKAVRKKTLVLDLDETLVHSAFSPFHTPSDAVIKLDLNNQVHYIHVLIRPGLDDFLKRMGEIYEIVIFTASLSKVSISSSSLVI